MFENINQLIMLSKKRISNCFFKHINNTNSNNKFFLIILNKYIILYYLRRENRYLNQIICLLLPYKMSCLSKNVLN